MPLASSPFRDRRRQPPRSRTHYDRSRPTAAHCPRTSARGRCAAAPWRQWACESPPRTGDVMPPVVFQTIPETSDGVQDLARALKEPCLVELGIEENLFELFHRMAG